MRKKILICAFACLNDPDGRFGFGKGGESELGWNIICQASKFGEVFVLTDISNRSAIEDKLNKKKLTGASFYFISLPRFLRFSKRIIQVYSYLWQIKAYFTARKLDKKFHFDVFHHATYANDWMASFIGALLPIPYVRGPGGGAHKVPKDFLKEYSLKEKCVQKLRGVGQWIFRHDPFFIAGHKKAKKILVCNKEAFDALPEKWRKKAEFFPVNGIPQKDLVFASSKLREADGFLVMSAGKLLKIKGFDLAIKAFKIFSQEADNARLAIVGSGPEFESLLKLSKNLGIANKVIFEKWVERQKFLEKIKSCDVFLFASLRDGGGQVVVEAMALGKPVICFDIAGPGFHIDDKCGIKIKPENSRQAEADMAAALKKLYYNKNLRDKLGDNAKTKAVKNYDWDVLGSRLEKIYKEFLNG